MKRDQWVKRLANSVKKVGHIYAPTHSTAHDPRPEVVEQIARRVGRPPDGTEEELEQAVIARVLPRDAPSFMASETHRRLIRAVIRAGRADKGLVIVAFLVAGLLLWKRLQGAA